MFAFLSPPRVLLLFYTAHAAVTASPILRASAKNRDTTGTSFRNDKNDYHIPYVHVPPEGTTSIAEVRKENGRMLFGGGGSNIIPLKIGDEVPRTFSETDLLRGFKQNVAEGEDPFKKKVFQGELVNTKFDTAHIDSNIITNMDELFEHMGISGELSISYGPTIRGTAGASYLLDKVRSENQMTVLYRSRQTAYVTSVDVNTLRLASGLDDFDPANIAEQYGTKFVERIYYGAQLDIEYVFTSSDSKDLLKIEGALSGNIVYGILSLDFEATLQLLQENNSTNLAVSIKATAAGVGEFSIPAGATLEDVEGAIDDFNSRYRALVDEAKEQEEVDGQSNILNKFTPIAFSLGSVADYTPKLKSLETIILDQRMSDIGSVFQSALYMKALLAEKSRTQEALYPDTRDRSELYLPYKAFVDSEISKIDDTIDKCLKYRRLPYVTIVGRDASEAAAVPDEYPKEEKDMRVIDGLLGRGYISPPATVGTTVFDGIYYEGFALPSQDGSILPWLQGNLRNYDDKSLVATAKSPRDLEKKGYAEVNGIEQVGFNYVRYGVPVYLESDSLWLTHESGDKNVNAVNYLPITPGLWIIRSETNDGIDPKDRQCLEYGDSFYLQHNETEDFIKFDYFSLPHLNKNEITETEKCPESTELTTVEECKKAGLILGGTLRSSGDIQVGDWVHVPCGCFTVPNSNTIHFDVTTSNPCRTNLQTHQNVEYMLICKTAGTSDNTSGSIWKIRDITNGNEGKCVQTNSNFYIQNNDQFRGKIGDDAIFLTSGTSMTGGEIEIQPESSLDGIIPQWSFRNDDETKDGFTCGAVSAHGKWRKVPQPLDGVNETEQIQTVRYMVGISGREIPPFWRHTTEWEKSVVASVSGGFTVMDDEDVSWFYGAQLAEAVQRAVKKNNYVGDLIWPDDFSWYYGGPRDPELACVQIYEGCEPTESGWDNNAFCWNSLRSPGSNLDLRWTQDFKPHSHFKCTSINDPKQPDHNCWSNNALCVPKEISVEFTWSHDGPIHDLSCIQWSEPWSYANGWDDNYLCAPRTMTDIQTKDVALGQQVWQFVFEVQDLCTGDDEKWNAMTDELAVTQHASQQPCCLPGFEADPDVPHGPCKLSSPCFCDREICEGGRSIPIPPNPEDDEEEEEASNSSAPSSSFGFGVAIMIGIVFVGLT